MNPAYSQFQMDYKSTDNLLKVNFQLITHPSREITQSVTSNTVYQVKNTGSKKIFAFCMRACVCVCSIKFSSYWTDVGFYSVL